MPYSAVCWGPSSKHDRSHPCKGNGVSQHVGEGSQVKENKTELRAEAEEH